MFSKQPRGFGTETAQLQKMIFSLGVAVPPVKGICGQTLLTCVSPGSRAEHEGGLRLLPTSSVPFARSRSGSRGNTLAFASQRGVVPANTEQLFLDHKRKSRTQQLKPCLISMDSTEV